MRQKCTYIKHKLTYCWTKLFVSVAINVVKRSHKLSNADLSVVLLEKPLDGIESYAVEVMGIPKECSEDLITLYFENSRRNGGGEIEEFIWDKNVGKAVITFKKSDGKLDQLVS